MKITFLGTGTSQGVPVIACPCPVCHSDDPHDKRLRSSLLIETKTANVVIDSGPDFRQQMLRENVLHLDAIVFTHEHKDHIAGMDDIRAYNFIQKKSMDIFAERRVQHALKREFAYVFAEYKYPGIPQVNLHTIENNKDFHINGLTFTPIRAYHYRLPIFGFRFGDVTYITDAKYIPSAELEKMRGTRILILNALRKKRHLTHFTLEEALDIVSMIKPETAYFTHISHQMGFHREVQAELPENVFPAYDGLSLIIRENN
ncbi:MAG TPA: MBL fold metallo-hydrolase [Bacteroidetes bacterium]|nr:MBL fold metallo-hydrolase [Bacteroidota bacterium]